MTEKSELWPEGMGAQRRTRVPYSHWVLCGTEGAVEEGDVLAIVYGEADEQARARAESIAAIPEGIAALEEATSHMPTVTTFQRERLRICRAALARLTGEKREVRK